MPRFLRFLSRILLFSLMALGGLIGLYVAFSWGKTALFWQSALGKDFSGLPVNERVSVADLSALESYGKVCFLHPYAVRSGFSQQSSLDYIFGDIDYSDWKEHIISRHTTKDTIWTFYPVADDKIVSAIPLYGVRKEYSPENRQSFRAGCYETSEICLLKTEKPKVVTIGSCEK